MSAPIRRLLILLSLALLRLPLSAQEVRVAAAANLRFVLEDVRQAYEQTHPGTRISVTLGASGGLLTQILNGAPFDLFISADRSFPDQLKQRGAAEGDVRTYAFGRVALWSGSIDVRKGLEVLRSPAVVHIAVARPEVAPYGARAVEALKAAGVYPEVSGKLVFAENIAQAAQYALTGNAEAGLLALSLVLGPEMRGKGTYAVLDTAVCPPVEQACVLVRREAPVAAAREFLAFLLSDACRPVFERYGYLLPRALARP